MQKALTGFFKDVIRRPSLYLFVVLIIFSIDRHTRYEVTEIKANGPFASDVYEYYSFLPEYFLDYEQIPGINFHTSKRTIGMAIMYSPAFLVGHCVALSTGATPDGYSWPYQSAVRWGSIIYCLTGLFLCRKSLLVFFSEAVTAISIICIFFATNLFFYTYGQGEFPHNYLFFLNAAVVFFTLKWIRENRPFFLLLISFALGMITLIRPTGILAILFPLLYNVRSREDLFSRIKYIFANDLVTFLSCLLFLLPLIFQMLVWKVYQGHFIRYSYGDERFFFGDPQIINFLFSFRKGWLIYTPIMVFSLVGMIFCRNRIKEFYPFMPLYFLLTVYILSCWWDWAFGGSFGCRALIESYAFLIFPFAAFVASLWHLRKDSFFQKNLVRLTMLFVFYLFIQLNLFQIWQYKYGRIHYNGMNWFTYKRVFLKDISTEESNALQPYYTSPDLEKMKRGEDRNQ
jgi:hypothetical protein